MESFTNWALDKIIAELKEVVRHQMLITNLLHIIIAIGEPLAVLRQLLVQQPFLLSVTRELFTII
jgi:hypothetical protein